MTNLITSVSDFFKNAWSGNLTQAQVDAIHASEAADIAKAAAGLNPAVVKEMQARAKAELDGFLLHTDQGPQGTGTGTGLRLPGLGVVGTAEFYSKLDTIVKSLVVVGFLAFGVWAADKFGLFHKSHGHRRG